MLNLIYKDQDKLVITGFKILKQSRYIRVMEIGGTISFSGMNEIKRPDIHEFFKGFLDPFFKVYMFEVLEQKGIKGLQFVEYNGEYHEYEHEDKNHIDFIIKNGKESLMEDLDDFQILII